MRCIQVLLWERRQQKKLFNVLKVHNLLFRMVPLFSALVILLSQGFFGKLGWNPVFLQQAMGSRQVRQISSHQLHAAVAIVRSQRAEIGENSSSPRQSKPCYEANQPFQPTPTKPATHLTDEVGWNRAGPNA